MSLQPHFPAEFDIRQSDICLFADWEANRYVKLVYPKRVANHDLVLYERMLDDAQHLWLEKYGTPLPQDDVEGCPVDLVSASAIPYEGSETLSADEWAVVKDVASGCDLTLDMLWFVIEGMKLRPGLPISEADPLWGQIIAHETTFGAGATSIVRALLTMPCLEWEEEQIWMNSFHQNGASPALAGSHDIKELKMATMEPMDFSKNMKDHPEISQLFRVLKDADPLFVAEGSADGKLYVIIGGPDDQFMFTKTLKGYTFEKTK